MYINQKALNNLLPSLLMLLTLSLVSHDSLSSEWVLKETWHADPTIFQEAIAHGFPVCLDDPNMVATYKLTVDDSTGNVSGQGKRVGYSCKKAHNTWEYKRVTGTINDNTLVISTGPSIYTEGSQVLEGYDDSIQIEIEYEDGAKNQVVLNDPSGHWQKINYSLSGKKIQKWNLTYKGYDVLHFEGASISGRRLQDGSADQLFGGLKVHWNLSVDFRVEETKEGKTYLGGSGTARVTGTEGFSKPPGVYDCNAQENPVPVSKDAFNVPGSISGDTVKLTLPETDYDVTIDCLLDSDALKDYIRANNPKITEFPSLERLPKHMRDQFTGIIVNPGYKTRTMPLQEHSKIIHSQMLEGLEYSLIKQR
jgi:hypothetical protein